MLEQNNTESLEQIITHIVKFTRTIEDYDFNETTTKQFVVLPILRALGWDDRNLETLEVFPESRTENGRVDYALQHQVRPLVFVECKRWRKNIENDEKQIADYILLEGVDLGVLTNGRTWNFYFAYKTHVPWQKRRFHSIELNSKVEVVDDFQKYLSKSRVLDGSAKKEAEKIVASRVDIPVLDLKPPSVKGRESRRIPD